MILTGDAAAVLRTLPAESVQCVVTSPPYYGLRNYGVAGQIGLERTVQEYVARLVEVFDLVHRVLRRDGTLWLNLGDSYATGAGKANRPGGGYRGAHDEHGMWPTWAGPMCQPNRLPQPGLKPKDLLGVPWRVAFALQEAGWYLRSDIIWHKPNPMPESVRDRPTRAHEYLFLLAKSERYYYDAAAVREPLQPVSLRGRPYRSGNRRRRIADGRERCRLESHLGSNVPWCDKGLGRNRRTVWRLPTARGAGLHFAVMPPGLIEPCILAGSRPGDLVLDPFAGIGTVGAVALAHGRRFLGIELNPAYAEAAKERLASYGEREGGPIDRSGSTAIAASG
jgi:DNA modification methylase